MPIPGLRGMSPLAVMKKSLNDFFKDDMTTYASAMAYQILFSIFPFLIFLIALLGFLELSSFFDWLRDRASVVFPQQAMDQVNQVINEVQKQQGGLLSFGMIVALWTASAAIRATMNALNVAYDVPEGRPAWKLYPLSILYTICIAVLMIAVAALLIIGPQAMQWIAEKVGLEDLIVTLWKWLRWPVALVILALTVAVVYYVAPNIKQNFKFLSPGALVAVVVWALASYGFNYYVSNFADYTSTYGSIGTIIVLLFYFFISSAVLLFGAEVNAAIERYSPSSEGIEVAEEPKE